MGAKTLRVGLIVLLLAAVPVLAQTGTVEGTVSVSDGSPAVHAQVMMHSQPGTPPLRAFTDASGGFTFESVEPDSYLIVARWHHGENARAGISVAADEVTYVTLTLQHQPDRPHHEIVELTGTVIVEPANEEHLCDWYFLDTDGNAVADVRLNFGPPWYEPDNGLTRPNDGDVVTVAGHVMDNPTLPVMIVFQLNGDVWRDPEQRPNHPRDSLTVVELSGTTIVEEANDVHLADWYFLDTDGNAEADVRLNFGPSWYEPDNGNVRPADGDQITVVGGQIGDPDRSVVIVYELNGLFWREPGQGHGGHGGSGGQGEGRPGFDPCEAVDIELDGTAMVHVVGPPHHPHSAVLIDIDNDEQPDYHLDFGPPWYDPDNGAVRPEDGDEISIVGGLIELPDAPLPWVIVYEINGVFWRESCDSSGVNPGVMEVDDENPVNAPTRYLTAKSYPNPFNPVATINYSIPQAGLVNLRIYDITGREVANLVNQHHEPGSYQIEWNAASLPSGMYFYRLTAANQIITNRMILMK